MNCIKIILVLTSLIVSLTSRLIYSFDGLKDPETTRLKSMAGAGVASILITEAPILNPASIVFFQNSTIQYQQSREILNNISNDRQNRYEDGKKELLVITDTTSGIKGGFSYDYQNVDAGKRKQFSLSFARNIGKKSGFGIIYKHNDEESLITNNKYNQIVIGGTHIISKDLTLGFNIMDALQREPEYFSYTLGAQYTLKDKINLIADIGSGDIKNYEEEGFTKICIQLEAFKSVFLRYGRFHDKRLNEKGTSVGFSWAGPKLALEYALKTSEYISENSSKLLAGEKLIDSSIGLTLIF